MDGHVRGDDARDSVLDVTTAGRTGNEHRIALARCMGLGALLIPLYYVLDVFVGYTLYGTGHLAVVIAVRAAAIVIAAAAWWIARDARFSDRTARVSHAIGLGLVAAAMSVLAYLHGGLVSPYIQGLTVMIMVRSATVPAPWRESVPHGVLVVMMYPAVFALIYASDPAAHAAWLTQDALALFLANWLIVVGAIFCGSLGSHATWVWKRQLFQARKLGRYRLQAPIGKGGQGEVWLARDATGRRNVALKVLSTRDALPHHLRMFEREAALASKLESPHAVRIFDFGASDDGVYYLAMEHLDGADLAALVRQHGPMPAARVIHFGIQACRSLEEAHAKGLVHRDVKPSNLFAAHVGGVYDHLKLLDYGIARSLSDDERLTRTGGMRGTPAYMAPEVCRGGDAGPGADLYGLGATLYHLLAGAPPFTGQDAEIIAKHLDATPEPLLTRAPVDADLEAVILRCLAKAPGERYADAAALRRALEQCAAAGAWTPEHATRFWRDERQSALARWEAETLP